MARDQDVGEGQQPRQDVVLQGPARAVLEEDADLLLVDVEPEVADLPPLQRIDDRACVDDGTSAGVDEHHARLDPPQGLGVDQVPRLGGQRAVEGHDVGLGQEPIHRHILDSERLAFLVLDPVVGEQAAPEPVHDPGDPHADLAGPHDADGPAVQVEAQQAVEREVPLAHPVVGAVELPVQCQHQPHGVLGDRVRRIGGDPRHRDPQFARGLDIHVVIPRTPHGQQPRPPLQARPGRRARPGR